MQQDVIVVTLDLNINNSNSGVDTQVHCGEYTWIDGVTYTESNNAATFTIANANNCDSIVTLDLIIYNSDNTSSSVIACDEFTWDGQTYTESGEYSNTYTNVNGCDSIHILNLTINPTTFGIDIKCTVIHILGLMVTLIMKVIIQQLSFIQIVIIVIV